MNALTVTTRLVPDLHVCSSEMDWSKDLFKKWYSLYEYSPQTADTYYRCIKQFMTYLEENGVTKPEKSDVLSYRAMLIKEGKKINTIVLYLNALKQFFKWTESEGFYPNIIANLKVDSADTSTFKKDYLMPEQANKLLGSISRDTLSGKRDYAILCLAITTGLRTIELARADVGDLQDVGGNRVLFIQGKGRRGKDDYVKIAPQVKEALEDYLSARTAAFKAPSSNDALFVSLSRINLCGRMTTRSFSRIAKEHLVEIGLNSSRITAHSLRHTAATLNLRAGATLEETQQLLRHSHSETTRIYSHSLERENNNSELRIANAVFDH